ncbi:uncharacterized protein LTHEOB_11720 [Lasiodiplodia theobromae]|uniref:uncharacterized protein n=1 Tax=Lasiodiplodia theobromae TaxID=45133 RepID=UPI0015C3DF3D|nr:uncharacterized protein LTHEOB_11720 [Lasiodiplodia theobromae]KAF4537011.1 hypothetical protein LTHEOB_11720 [Lasiodiplodia theobromae]
MPGTSLFPVVCTAEVPTSVIDKLLSEAHAASERLVPGSEPCLAVITTTAAAADGALLLPSSPSQPPLEPFASAFLGQPVEAVAQRLSSTDASFFAVLDERSAADETALVVVASRGTGGGVQDVRVTFDEVQRLLTALDVGSLGIEEVRSIAESNGRVYGPARESAQKGQPAPRKRLGA